MTQSVALNRLDCWANLVYVDNALSESKISRDTGQQPAFLTPASSPSQVPLALPLPACGEGTTELLDRDYFRIRVYSASPIKIKDFCPQGTWHWQGG